MQADVPGVCRGRRRHERAAGVRLQPGSVRVRQERLASGALSGVLASNGLKDKEQKDDQ